MQKIKTPLWIMTITFATSFFDGAFGWGLQDETYVMMGIAQIVAIIWLWVLVNGDKE